MSWGCPHREPEGVRRCSIVEGGEELTSPADFLSFSSSVGMGGGHFQGLVGVTVTLTVTVSLSSSGVRGVDVEQSPPALSLQEGSSYTLRCNFSTFTQSVNWYLQNPGGRLIHLFSVPSGTKQEGRLRTPQLTAHFLSVDHRLGHLLLCCAARCSPGTCSLYTNLQPRLQTHPAVLMKHIHTDTHTSVCA